MNNLPKVVTQQRRGRASNPRLLDRKYDALPLSHRAIQCYIIENDRCVYRTSAISAHTSAISAHTEKSVNQFLRSADTESKKNGIISDS